MKIPAVLILIAVLTGAAHAQNLTRDFPAAARPQILIENQFGQIRVVAEDERENKISLEAASPQIALTDKDLSVEAEKGNLRIVVNETKNRVDLILRVPERSRLKITGKDGEVALGGNLESAEVSTATGTIYAQIPLDSVKFDFLWTESKPRLVSDAELPEAKEKAGGKFSVAGKLGEADSKSSKSKVQSPKSEEILAGAASDDEQPIADDKKKKKKPKERKGDKLISLDFRTERGVILLNVPPSEVPSDLRARELTRAAKAIIQSGDSILTEAVRRASPRRFGDYAKTLPPFRSAPTLKTSEKRAAPSIAEASAIKRVNVGVTDSFGRAISNLSAADFTVFESNAEREILDVQPTTTPFNLILLLDVSGSVAERIDFIRKAARNFINTVSPQDKIAVIVFRDDVQVLSAFTTDKTRLSAALDTFDAGGGTALYDALAFSLVDALKPLRGERTAIVILSDGDDSRSFVPFDALLGAIEESGALIYPLYVPSGLIPANSAADSIQTADPLRTRYLTLTTKAEAEGRGLAQVSGGVYFPIRQIEQLQTAYEDVVTQLRTSYTLTFRSKSAEPGSAPARLRVTVKRAGASVRLGAVVGVSESRSSDAVPRPIFSKTADSAPFLPIAFKTALDAGDVTGEVKQIKYKQLLIENLREFSLENFDVNRAPPAFVLKNGERRIAVSRWVSPKRTRSYPYERTYNTLSFPKRAAVIPLVKDEGAGGDRDFLQWDTFSLMNLLEVHVVLGYYDAATKSPRRENGLLEQKFNNAAIAARLKELTETNLSAYEWNLRELKNLPEVVKQVKIAYEKISAATGVRLHDAEGLNNFERKLSGDVSKFLEFSRQKAQQAQRREFLTDQPKETMPTDTKSRITISDYLGGKYFYTVDEAVFERGTLFLIESKHHQGGKLTGKGDIKEGLVKMIIYRNLTNVRRDGKTVEFKVVLRLTASEMKGAVTSDAKDDELAKFVLLNNFDRKQAEMLQKLFAEARENSFLIKLERADTRK